jgi:Regulator of chromosome condensation (RCC1) repeat
MTARSTPGVARRAGAAAAIAALLVASSVGGLATLRAAAASGEADGGGIVVALGYRGYTGVSIPDDLNDVVAISAGQSFPLALRSNGTVVELRVDMYGHSRPAPAVTDVVAISAGRDFDLALKRDGSVARWSEGIRPEVPLSIIATDATAISDGMLLKRDGTVQLVSVTPSPGAAKNSSSADPGFEAADERGVIAISGGTQSLVLHGDGTVGAVRGPKGVPASLTNVVAISAGQTCSMALKQDGSVEEWAVQDDPYGACVAPSGLTGVVAVSAGNDFSLVLKSDGTVVAWGNDNDGAVKVPAGMAGVKAISAGGLAFAIVSRRDNLGLIAAVVMPLILVALAALLGHVRRRRLVALTERLESFMPTYVAVALALLSVPLVALTIHPNVANAAGSPAAPIDRWLSAAGAALVSAVVAGTLGGFAARRIGWIAIFPTFLLALVVAAPAAVIVPGIFGHPVAFVTICNFAADCSPILQSTDPRNAILASPLAVLAPLVEPVAVVTLAVGVVIWWLAIRHLPRAASAGSMATESAPPANGGIPGM